MQVDQHIETVLFTPFTAVIKIDESVFPLVSFFILKNYIIYRHSHMIEAYGCDILDIRLRNEGIKVLLVILGILRYPSA